MARVISENLWFVVPTVVSILALLWASYWPIEPGYLRQAKHVAMLLAAFIICAVVWCLGAIFK